MTMTLDKPVGRRGDMQDRVRTALLSYGSKEINASIDDLIGKTGLTYPQIYQTLYRLQQTGELEILREQESNGRFKVSGIKLNKSESSEIIQDRINAREDVATTNKDLGKVAINVPNTLEYIRQKIAIEKARDELSKAGIDPTDVINFETNLLGEEAVILLSKVQELIEANRMLTNDLEAEKRNVRHLQAQRVEVVTFDDSGT